MTDFLDANEKFRHAASVNAKASNWKGDPKHRGWKPAYTEWQEFAEKWRNVDDQIFHAEPRMLDLAPIPGVTMNRRILIRTCYVKAEQVVWHRAVDHPEGGVLFTGQPGIGKTFFIWYLLVRLLRMKQPVLLHLTPSTPLLFWHDAVYTVPEETTVLPSPSTGSPFIWSLFDLKNQQPPWMACSPEWCFPVQALSPGENWYGTWTEERGALVTGFPLWTREELASVVRLGRKFQAFWDYLDKHWKTFLHQENESDTSPYRHVISLLRENPTDKAPGSTEEAFDVLLDVLVSRFGLIPRDIIRGLNDFPSQAQDHKDALKIQPKELEDIVWEVAQNLRFPNTSSQHIVSINPIGEIGEPGDWAVKFKSTHIEKQVSHRLINWSKNEVHSFITRLSPMPEGKCLSGSFFKPLVHQGISWGVYLSDPGSWTLQRMRLRKSDRPDAWYFIFEDYWTVSGFLRSQRRQVQFANDELPRRLSNHDYYVPSESNFPLIDSFVVDLDFTAGSAHLWLLQISTSDKSDGSEEGYVEIRKIIGIIREMFKEHDSDWSPPEKKLKGQGGKPSWSEGTPRPSVQVHYVLVCPSSQVKCGLKLVLPNGWDQGITHQGDGYVLGFPLS